MQSIAQKLVLEALSKNITDRRALQKLKNRYSSSYKINALANQELFRAYRMLREKGNIEKNLIFEKLIQKRAIRSLSGVAVVTVLTKPYPCPGKCVFCPAEDQMPKSYLSNEPGAMRALLNDFDPYRQVKNRLHALHVSGHPTDKIELIVLGGTFSAYPRRYQKDFIRQCLNALNGGKKERSFAESMKKNETARHRVVGLSLETRPDCVTVNEIRYLRELGCTKIQLGVQHLENSVLDYVKRGHTVEEVIEATKICKNAGLKICYHMMPNLPGSTPERDLIMFRELFKNPDFQPDYLKIYPCTVTPWSELEHWFKKGKYFSYDLLTLEKLIIEIKKIIPKYVRIDRLVRDIPGESILEGSKVTNLRQELARKYPNIECQCIRCREIRDEPIDLKKIKYEEIEYEASEGKEYFLTYIQGEKLCAMLRLRVNGYSRHSAIIREVHTFGTQIEIGKKGEQSPQHLGLGKKLIQEAEKIAKQNGYNKIAVIASIGTREYYRRLEYRLQGTYMVKNL